jgi:D-glycero-alpha-D-manno-heptose-7-phosphate kinase
MRADLAGGTLDIWPLSQIHPGASTVNVALRLSARARFTPGGDSWKLRAGDQGASRRVAAGGIERVANRARPGDPFALVTRVLAHVGAREPGRLVTEVEGPAGAGLGGSSALLIALYGLACRLTGRRLDRGRMAEVARDLESRVLGLPTGVQDYHPAIRGGALRLRYEPGRTLVERLDVDLDALSSRLVLAYSGRPHASAPSNWGIYRRRLENDPAAVTAFGRIVKAADRAGRALERGDWASLGRAMTADWAARKELEPALAPPDLRALEAAGLAAGARAAKCCGAASGGCMLFLLRRPGDRSRVEGALKAAGAQLLSAATSSRGLRLRSLKSERR